MKQFGKILKFELTNYLKNKVFMGITLFFVIVLSIVMCIPRIVNFFESNSENESPSETENLPLMLIVPNAPENAEALNAAFSSAFTNYNVQLTDADTAEVQDKIATGNAACAFVLDSLTSYTYYVDNLSMYDSNTAVANEVLQTVYQMNAMVNSGISPDEASQILSAPIMSTTVNLGVDQMQNYWYTYIMIFALYMVILLYGQMVATNVATEKSSRAMEVLITSANPVSMMFGKVLASCLAGLIQLIAVFGSAIVAFNLNKTYWGDIGIITSMFDMPVSLFFFMLLFFILGFLIYAFLFGAIGSTASKLEDINTSVMPITLVFVAAFIIVMTAMSSGNVDSLLMKVCSYVPFTSPMAMFTRLAMSTVPWYEVLLSIGVLVGSVIGVGIVSAKIYRVGVLLYGTPPKLGAIIKAIRKA